MHAACLLKSLSPHSATHPYDPPTLHATHNQMEFPPRRDLVALGLGHGVLAWVCGVALWAYVSVRLWRLHHPRAAHGRRRPLLQVAASVGRWTLSSAALVGRLAKLVALLSFELGVFPLAVGFWLDVCALPLSGSKLDQRVDQLLRAPGLSTFVHFVLGVGFMLALAFSLCIARQVLRPGALPFIRVRGAWRQRGWVLVWLGTLSLVVVGHCDQMHVQPP